MAVVARYSKNGGLYVLLAGGFGAYHASVTGVSLASPVPDQKTGIFPMALLCDHAGKTGWVDSENVDVVSIDGRSPADLLQEAAGLEESAGG